jgi:broad specificity phosphatase PhoE
MTTKTIYLIRHAQSTNQQDKLIAKSTWEKIITLSGLPTLDEISTTVQLLKFDMDSSLTQKGQLQIIHQRDLLIKQDFLQSHHIELILHSPLIRAKETCLGLFSLHHGNIPIQECSLLYEKSIIEHFIPMNLDQRIEKIKHYLMFDSKENNIVIVAHSGLFRAFLNHDKHHPDNCEIIQCQLSYNSINKTFTTSSQGTIVEGGELLLAV